MNSLIDHISYDLSLDRSYIASIINRSIFYYRRFTIPKKNGGERVIYQASPELKSLQYWVRENVLKILPVSNAAFAYQTGDSIKRHAAFHKGAYFIFHTDIERYFPSIRSKMLSDILEKHQEELRERDLWFEDSCEVIAKICFRNDSLTIGTVSSPMISNIIAYDFDEILTSYAERIDCRYSRYADDIYISGRTYIPNDTKKYVKDCLLKYGFRMNETKTWFKSKKSRRKVKNQNFTSTAEIMEAMKEMFRDVIQTAMEVELDSEFVVYTEFYEGSNLVLDLDQFHVQGVRLRSYCLYLCGQRLESG